MHHFKLSTLKYELLKVSAGLQTACAVGTLLAEGQWLEKQVDMMKLRMFRVETR
jgi:hypothetical protein